MIFAFAGASEKIVIELFSALCRAVKRERISIGSTRAGGGTMVNVSSGA
jgi:hypothetical protein